MSLIVGMLLSLIAGFGVAYLIFFGEIMYEQNSTIRAQVFSNIVRLVVTLASVLSALIVVGVGFSFMMNKNVVIIQTHTKNNAINPHPFIS